MESISLLFKVLWAPAEALFKVAKSRKVLAPLILLTAAGIVSFLVTSTRLDMKELMVRAMEQRGQVAQPEQIERMMPVVRGFAVGGAVFGPTVMILLVTVIYFGLFTLLGREGGFKSFFAVTAFAFVPSIVRNAAATLTVLVVPQAQIMPDEIGNIGPAVLLDRGAMSSKLFAAIAQIDVVSLWILALLVIGYRFVTRKSVGVLARTVCVFGVWLVYVAFRVTIA
jgi:Yip1-like protein